MEEEDGRREAAIASASSLQPNFKPVGVSQAQLSKFQELHKRRLQIKAKSKIKKSSKGNSGKTDKSHGKRTNTKDCTDNNNSSIRNDDSSVSVSVGNNTVDMSSPQQQNITAGFAPKKRQKLHWGLDTKERWERKANM